LQYSSKVKSLIRVVKPNHLQDILKQVKLSDTDEKVLVILSLLLQVEDIDCCEYEQGLKDQIMTFIEANAKGICTFSTHN